MTIYFFELVTIMIIGYFGFKQGIIFMGTLDEEKITTEPVKYKVRDLSNDVAKEFLPVLLSHMKIEKPYLDNRLSISELADQIKIPSYQLSKNN